MRTSLVLLLTLGVATLALAQPDPNAPPPTAQPVPPQPAVMKMPLQMPTPTNTAIAVTANGFYVMTNGALAKFNLKTLAVEGTLRLLEQPTTAPPRVLPMPMARVEGIAPPVAPPAVNATQVWQAQQARWSATPLLLTTETSLVVVQGDAVFRVDQQALTLLSQVTLPLAAVPTVTIRIMYAPAGTPTLAKASEDTVYLLRGAELWAVDTVAGTAFGPIILPQAPPANPIVRPLPITPGGPVLMNDALPLNGPPVLIDWGALQPAVM
jgi:hypothetical protein